MGEELGRGQAGEERVANEAFGWRFSSLLLEVREEAVLEAVWDTVAGDDLLPDDGYHLRDVDLGACRP